MLGLLLGQPTIAACTDAQWREYYEKKHRDDHKQIMALKAEIEDIRKVAVQQILDHAVSLADVRARYGEWLFHLVRLGLKPDCQFDITMYARRIARSLSGSKTADDLRGLLGDVPGSILRKDEDAG
jgi:hypothetical protein